MAIVNQEQAEAWNGYEGEHWAEHYDRYDAVNQGFNRHLLAEVGLADRVLDVGCGNGQVTRLAARQAPEGYAVGLDLSAPMLARARAQAAAEELRNISFVEGDAQVHPWGEAEFDVVISRFGVMFFADPVAAFGNLRQALRPGGRLAALCLRGLEDQELKSIFAAIGPHLPAPDARPEKDSGPLSLAEPRTVHTILADAGFADLTVAPVDALQTWGRDPAGAADFLLAWGPLRHQLRDADPTTIDRVRELAVDAFGAYAGPEAVRLRAGAWLVTASRPA